MRRTPTDGSDSGSDPLNDTTPCVGCGLCCNGTLYDLVKLAPDEEPRAKALELEQSTVGERTYFHQPCRFFDCGQCSIYETRWQACRSFHCGLLRSYQAGEVDLEEARATIAQAFDLLAAVTGNDAVAATVRGRRNLRRELAQQMQTGSDEQRRKAAPRLLSIMALENFLDRRFRNRKKELEPSFDEMPDSAG